MVTLNPVQWDFSGGVIGKKFRGAVDSTVYLKSIEAGLNVLVTSQGKLIRRPGTEKVKNRSDTLVAYGTSSATGDLGSNTSFNITFNFNSTTDFRILLEHDVIYIFNNSDNLIQTISSSGITNTALANLAYDQGRDVIIFCHSSFGFKTLRRNVDATWTLSALEIEDGPYEFINLDKNQKLHAGAKTGTTTLTAKDKGGTNITTFFQSTDVGRLYRLRHSPSTATTWGVCKVTSLSGGPPSAIANVTIPAEYELEDGGAGAPAGVKNWVAGSWYGTNYPTVIKFAQNRLWAGYLDRLHGSFADDFNRFSTSTENIFDADDGHLVTDACAIDTRITNLKGEKIYWIHEDEVIHIGGEHGHYTLRGTSLLGPITPSTATISEQSSMGCADVSPISLGSLIYLHKSGKKVFASERNFRTDRYETIDLNQYADDIFDAKVIKIIKTTYPYPIAWFILSNGDFVSLTYIKETEIIAWSKHRLASGDVQNATVILDSAGRERIYFIVKNGSNYYVEKMGAIDPGGDNFLEGGSKLLDGGLSYFVFGDTTTIDNLERFEGETFYAVSNHHVLSTGVVTDGSVTLDVTGASGIIEFGLNPEVTLTTLPIEAKSNEQSTIGEQKQGVTVNIGLFNTGHLEVRQKGLTEWSECVLRETTNPTGVEASLFTGTTEQLKIPGQRVVDLQYEFRQRLPSPLGISHIGVRMDVSSV